MTAIGALEFRNNRLPKFANSIRVAKLIQGIDAVDGIDGLRRYFLGSTGVSWSSPAPDNS